MGIEPPTLPPTFRDEFASAPQLAGIVRNQKEEMPMTRDLNVCDGGCTCGHVRYRMTSNPIFVHCCHCTWCQRETGSAFAVNALIEADRVQLLQGTVEIIDTPSQSNFLLMSTSTPDQNRPGLSCLQGYRPSMSTTEHRTCGPKTVWIEGPHLAAKSSAAVLLCR